MNSMSDNDSLAECSTEASDLEALDSDSSKVKDVMTISPYCFEPEADDSLSEDDSSSSSESEVTRLANLQW